jgi:hypothetical protein
VTKIPKSKSQMANKTQKANPKKQINSNRKIPNRLEFFF